MTYFQKKNGVFYLRREVIRSIKYNTKFFKYEDLF